MLPYLDAISPINSVGKNRRVGHPKFKSGYDSHQSARFTANARFKVELVHERQAILTPCPRLARFPSSCLGNSCPIRAVSLSSVSTTDVSTYRLWSKPPTPEIRLLGGSVVSTPASTTLPRYSVSTQPLAQRQSW